MQTASTNICERLCNKSINEISLLLNIPQSTVSGIITKWKELGMAATQPRSGRPRKKNERAGSAHAEVHSAQKLPTVCRVNS
ncbi:unnamed protein product [Staurois parvus]|uniref:Insertion element IS150 protein InsJ-like helix-turn-helix domain-containing protein n=1 Tax=Staurois parvus TaxID=386267 RepID=A0ABN9ASV5_9NEOB|nr:unnamed protein product [Staurois parvus]